jgi:hypothetical protein
MSAGDVMLKWACRGILALMIFSMLMNWAYPSLWELTP